MSHAIKSLDIVRLLLPKLFLSSLVLSLLVTPYFSYAENTTPESKVSNGVVIDTSGKRFTLIIGNSAYSEKPLINPKHDAEDMAKALKELGFEEPKVLYDATRSQILNALEDIKLLLLENPNSIVVYYFAGHGLQVDGVNYLLPIGSDYASKIMLENGDGIKLDTVLSSLKEGQPKAGIVILDACRDNPYKAKLEQEARSAKIAQG